MVGMATIPYTNSIGRYISIYAMEKELQASARNKSEQGAF